MYTRFVIIAVIAVLLIIFILQNSGSTNIRFLFWTIAISKSVLAILCFLLGFLFSSYTWIKAVKKEKHKKRL